MASGTPDYQGTIGRLKSLLSSIRVVSNPIIWSEKSDDTHSGIGGWKRVYTITAKGSIVMLYIRFKYVSSSQNEENVVIKIEIDSNLKLQKQVKTIFHEGNYAKGTNAPIQLHTYDTSNKIYAFTMTIPFTFDSDFVLTIFGPAADSDTIEVEVLVVFNVEGGYTTSNSRFTAVSGATNEGSEQDSGTGETFDI